MSNQEKLSVRGLVALGASSLLALALGMWGFSHPPLNVHEGLTQSSSPAQSAPRAGGIPPGKADQAVRLGARLADTRYAKAAFQLYPGPMSEKTMLSLAGFTIKFTHTDKGEVTLSISVMGRSGPPHERSFAVGDKVYFIETDFGDDEGYDYESNFGDDGLIITNPDGYIILPPKQGS